MKKIMLFFLTTSLLAGFQPSYGASGFTTVVKGFFSLSAAASLWVMFCGYCGDPKNGKDGASCTPDSTKQFRAAGGVLVGSLGGLAWSVWNGREKKSDGKLKDAVWRRRRSVWWRS